MTSARAVFWDIGGVLLSNGWDREQRARVVERFGLDPADFQERHHLIVPELELGRVSLGQYLDQTVFHRQRPFTREAFTEAMLGQSEPNEDALALARRMAGAGRLRMYALNNESRELNAHRVRAFGLDEFLLGFFTSCYLGVAKPNPSIYRLALDLAGVRPEDAAMVDDRPQNVEAARAVGMRAVRFEGAAQLEAELGRLGLTP